MHLATGLPIRLVHFESAVGLQPPLLALHSSMSVHVVAEVH